MPVKQASRAVKLFGTDVADSRPRELRAGPVSAMLDNGALRYIKLDDTEVLRAIAFLVRDENWGTYTPKISNARIRTTGKGFTVTFDARCADAKQSLAFRAEIVATVDGRIAFTVIATPETDFRTNRTGFVVLHPLKGVAGQPVDVEEVGGKCVKSKFPALIDPVQPFFDIRSLRHKVAPGVFAVCRMEGDTFEMEDHRNWTDASFKTYVRPLALPWPYVLPKGKAVTQSVTLTFTGKLPRQKSTGRAKPVEVKVGRPAGEMPVLAVAVGPDDLASALTHASLVKAAGLPRLVCTIDAARPDLRRTVDGIRKLHDLTGAEIALEIIVPGRETPARELAAVAAAVGESGLRPESVLVSPAIDLKAVLPGSEGGDGPTQQAIHAAARRAFPGSRIGGGMLSFFTELNRKRPPVAGIDFITHTTCPIVHAADDISVMETLEALPYVVRSAQAFGGGKPYRVGPTSIPARLNPYGAGMAPNPDNGRVCLSSMDPRQRGIFGAAWTLGYLATLAPLDVDAVAMGSATGQTGMIHAGAGSAAPYFDARMEGAVYPLYHVLAGIAPASGSKCLAANVSDPQAVAALAFRGRAGTELWLGNLTGEARRLKVAGLDGAATLATLDAGTFARASRDPGYLRRSGKSVKRIPTLDLGPYAVMRIVVR
ncbi:MAG TPA: hypothetical protein VJS40_00530 [Aestuariivirgaceae bacterium]|nr:hypothetical protein [Aestuariivirgaceae bacterium]